MARTRWIPLLIVSLVALTLMMVPSLRGGSGVASRTTNGAAEESDDGPRADLGRVEPRGAVVGTTEEAIEAPSATETRRVSAHVEDDVEITSSSAVANVLPSLQFARGFQNARPNTNSESTVKTDARGVFVFRGSDRERSESLRYGTPILLGRPLSVCVDPEAEWQILRLPPFDAQQHTWTVDVVAEVMGPSVTGEGESWVDPATGVLEWLPADLLRIAESAENRHFAQTLRVGHGPVKSAELIVKMRATALASENDGIYLEHLGKRSFAWRGSISDLIGRQWRRGNTTTLYLDLARLPVKGKGPFDLRSYLEDGLLDVVVQDDTTIDDISVRVIR